MDEKERQKRKAELITRLKKIEGQVRGVQKMLDEDRYCVDVLVQVAAIRSAVNKVGLAVLEGHTRGCVAKAIQENHGDKAIDELMDVMIKFIK